MAITLNPTHEIRDVNYYGSFSSTTLNDSQYDNGSDPVLDLKLKANSQREYLYMVHVIFRVLALPSGTFNISSTNNPISFALVQGANEIATANLFNENDDNLTLEEGEYALTLMNQARNPYGLTAPADVVTSLQHREGNGSLSYVDNPPSENRLIYNPTYDDLFGTGPDGFVTQGMKFDVEVIARYYRLP